MSGQPPSYCKASHPPMTLEPAYPPLDGVGEWVFTRCIEHTFEFVWNRMMQEVLL